MGDGVSMSGGHAARDADREFLVGLSRAFGGAIFFSLPLLMTMEMWWLGFTMGRLHLALLLAVFFPLLVGLDRFSGFMETSGWWEDVVDALVAYAVGFVASGAILLLLGVLEADMGLRELVGTVALQAVPASLGAVLANSQLKEGMERDRVREQRKEHVGYGGELLFLTTGALFLAFNVAPTEEMFLIAFKMTAWHALALLALTLLLMHAVVYTLGFRGAPEAPEEQSAAGIFLRFTVVGYAIALLVSAYVLWTFGRFEDGAYAMYAREVLVLGFPAGLGAAGARIIL